MSDIPRRTLLLAAPAAAVVAAVAAETGITLASAADPYVRLCAEYHHEIAIVDDGGVTDAVSEAAYQRFRAACDRLAATRATTLRGAREGLKIALYEFGEHYGRRDGCQGDRMMFALIESAITVLDRETAHV